MLAMRLIRGVAESENEKKNRLVNHLFVFITLDFDRRTNEMQTIN